MRNIVPFQFHMNINKKIRKIIKLKKKNFFKSESLNNSYLMIRIKLFFFSIGNNFLHLFLET